MFKCFEKSCTDKFILLIFFVCISDDFRFKKLNYVKGQLLYTVVVIWKSFNGCIFLNLQDINIPGGERRTFFFKDLSAHCTIRRENTKQAYSYSQDYVEQTKRVDKHIWLQD